MPALSSSPTAVLVDDSDPVLGELAAVPAAPPGLLQCLQKVTDPRKRRGVRHPITGVVAVALAATMAGAQSFLGIAEWAADAGAGELAALGLRNRGRYRLPARGASPATDPQDPPPPRRQVAHRNRLRRNLAVRHRRPPFSGRRLVARALGHREPNPLGSRRHLRRRPIPDPHQRRTSGHGHPEKHRHQPSAPEQPDQHRRRPTTSQPRPTPPNHTPADLLKHDFAEALSGSALRAVARVPSCPSVDQAQRVDSATQSRAERAPTTIAQRIGRSSAGPVTTS